MVRSTVSVILSSRYERVGGQSSEGGDETRTSLILNIACPKAREHDVCVLCVCVACVCVCVCVLSVLGVVIGVVACS